MYSVNIQGNFFIILQFVCRGNATGDDWRQVQGNTFKGREASRRRRWGLVSGAVNKSLPTNFTRLPSAITCAAAPATTSCRQHLYRCDDDRERPRHGNSILDAVGGHHRAVEAAQRRPDLLRLSPSYYGVFKNTTDGFAQALRQRRRHDPLRDASVRVLHGQFAASDRRRHDSLVNPVDVVTAVVPFAPISRRSYAAVSDANYSAATTDTYIGFRTMDGPAPVTLPAASPTHRGNRSTSRMRAATARRQFRLRSRPRAPTPSRLDGGADGRRLSKLTFHSNGSNLLDRCLMRFRFACAVALIAAAIRPMPIRS